MKTKVKIVLSGSGTLYPLHAGALWALWDAGYEAGEIAGVSGGAIIAAAVASGYRPGEELNTLLLETLPAKNKLLDFSWMPWWHWGLLKGNKLERKFKQIYVPTFFETTIPLHIVGVNLDTMERVIWNFQNSPNMNLSKAVRASISIPGVFKPVLINGDYHVDGGVAGSFLPDIYGEDEPEVMAFRILSTASLFERISSATDYIFSVIGTMLESLDAENIEDAGEVDQLNLLTDESFLNFNMDKKKVEELIQQGYDQTMKWLTWTGKKKA